MAFMLIASSFLTWCVFQEIAISLLCCLTENLTVYTILFANHFFAISLPQTPTVSTIRPIYVVCNIKHVYFSLKDFSKMAPEIWLLNQHTSPSASHCKVEGNSSDRVNGVSEIVAKVLWERFYARILAWINVTLNEVTVFIVKPSEKGTRFEWSLL